MRAALLAKLPLTLAALTLTAITLNACVAPEDAEPIIDKTVPSLATDQMKPRLALVEHVLSDYFAQDIANRPTVCASVIEESDQVALSAEEETALILRFSQLAPFSRCVKQGGEWRDSASDEAALVFGVHSFECAQETRCTGWAGYQAGAAGSLSYRYTMDWLDGEWTFGRDPRIIAEDEAQGGAVR